MTRHSADITVDLDQRGRRKMRVVLKATILSPGETRNIVSKRILHFDFKITGDFDPLTWPAEKILARLLEDTDLPLPGAVTLTVQRLKRPWHQRLLGRGTPRRSLRALQDRLSAEICAPGSA